MKRIFFEAVFAYWMVGGEAYTGYVSTLVQILLWYPNHRRLLIQPSWNKMKILK